MNQIRAIPLIFFCLVVAGPCLFASGSAEPVTIRTGRSIQLDGFLIDWQEKTRRQWPGSANWFWDAASTPEGVAGYCTGQSAGGAWTLYVAARGLSRAPWEMVSTNADKPGGWYRARQEVHNGVNRVTMEWLIPWDSIAIDSTGAFAIHLAGRGTPGDTLAPLFLTGNIHAAPGRSPLPQGFAAQLIIIAIMLGLFIGLQFIVRKKTRRRGSLRRSA